MMVWLAIGLALAPGIVVALLALLVHPTQEDYDKYGPSYMMSRRAKEAE